MSVAVHESRDNAATGGVEPLVPGRSGGRCRDSLAVDHEGGVAHEPERSLAEGGLARHEEADIVDDEGARCAQDRLMQLVGDVDGPVPAVTDDFAAVHEHMPHVWSAPANTTA